MEYLSSDSVLYMIAGGLAILALLSVTTWRIVRRRVREMPARIEFGPVYLTAEGSMLDVRYRVKRRGLLVTGPGQIFVLAPNGAPCREVASVAKIGRLATRRANRKTGGYFLVRNCANVSQGDRVTVIIGRNHREGLVVQ